MQDVEHVVQGEEKTDEGNNKEASSRKQELEDTQSERWKEGKEVVTLSGTYR